MSAAGLQRIESRDNPLVRQLRRLQEQSMAYRRLGHYWIEGEHLCLAARQAGAAPLQVVLAEGAQEQLAPRLARDGERIAVLPDRLFAELSGLPSPGGVGYLMALPPGAEVLAGAPAVVLDRLQDAGNVGSVLRSAAAFGFRQVLAISGTAGLWSPKVLRAAMGAHFSLHLVESLSPEAVAALGIPLLATSSHAGAWLHEMAVPWPCAWVFGHEGQGVAQALEALAAGRVRIAQPGGQESLNVAAAAAICLHASATQRAR